MEAVRMTSLKAIGRKRKSAPSTMELRKQVRKVNRDATTFSQSVLIFATVIPLSPIGIGQHGVCLAHQLELLFITAL
jgi:hypothetical protein